MKSTGIVRGIDPLGRIVLPKELRNRFKLGSDAKLEIFVEGETILLKKYQPAGACEFCGEITEDAVSFGDVCICAECRRKIAAL